MNTNIGTKSNEIKIFLNPTTMTAKRKYTKLKTLRLTLEESGYKLSELMYPSKGLEDSICDAMNRYTQQELESKEQEIENLKRES